MTTDQSQVELATRYLGQRTRRKEDPRLLTGQGRYVGDVALVGMSHVAFVRSPYALASIERISSEHASTTPGVRAILTVDDLRIDASLLPIWRGLTLAEDHVSYVGEPVVMVIADSRSHAEDAAEAIEVDYLPLEPVVELEKAVADMRSAHPGDGSNVSGQMQRTSPGDDSESIKDAFATAPHVFRERIEQHRYLCSPMETRGIVAEWQSSTQSMTVWISIQGPHPAVDHFARVLQIPQNHVRVVATDVGGGFGQKIMVYREETAVALAARLLDRPLKWIEDRYENLVAGSHARREFCDISIATDDDGLLRAISVDHYQDCGAYGLVRGENFAFMVPGPYRVPKVDIRSCSVQTNTGSRGAYRGPWMMETVQREIMMDIIARSLRIDPVEIRRRNVIRREDLPHTTVTGAQYDLLTVHENLERAIQAVDYENFRREQAEERTRGRYLGLGISLFIEPTAQSARNISDGIAVRIDSDGKVLVASGSGSQGHSVETTICQIVADELGVHIDDVNIVIGDSATTPFGTQTGGSRSAISTGNGAIVAATTLRQKILAIAADALEAPVEDLELKNRQVSIKGIPSRSLPLADIAKRAQSSATLPSHIEPGLETIGRFTPETVATFSNAAHLAVVDVDITTGEVAVLRYIVSEDCGVMINPNVVDGQIAGGVIQGIGGVLLENFVYDQNGNPLTTTFLDYLLPTTTEVPLLEYDHLESPAPSNPGGFKGIGEGGAIGAPAAIVNAVADALAPFGVKITSQPLTPPILLDLLDEAKRQNSEVVSAQF